MANYSLSIDLLALLGAQYVNGPRRAMRPGETPEQYAKVQQVPGVFIPCDANEIRVSEDRSDGEYRNASGYRAMLRLMAFQLQRNRYNEKLFASIEARLQADGKQVDEFSLPSQQVCVSYSQDYSAKLLDAAIIVERAAHPEWAALDINEKAADGTYVNRAFRSAVYSHIPNRLGLGYTVRPKDYVAPVPVQTSPLGVFSPAPAPEQSQGEVAPDDDLPF